MGVKSKFVKWNRMKTVKQLPQYGRADALKTKLPKKMSTNCV